MSTALWDQLADARAIDLSHEYRTGMPQSPNHPPFRMVIERRHGDMVRADGGSAANELIILGGHVGTHMDALGHVSQDGKLSGGTDALGDISHLGLATHGIDQVPPFAGRGVLLDVAAVHGVDSLPGGYEVTVEDLEEAERRAGVQVRAGDGVLIGTGWARNWEAKEVFIGAEGGCPGPGVPAAEWLADRRPRLVGAETIAFECIKPGMGHALLPAHRVLLVERAINIVETLNLTELSETGISEFGLVLSPLRLVGATGAPARPLALIDPPKEPTHA